MTEIERKIKRFYFDNLHVLAKWIPQILVKTDEFEKEVHEIKLKRTTISTAIKMLELIFQKSWRNKAPTTTKGYPI